MKPFVSGLIVATLLLAMMLVVTIDFQYVAYAGVGLFLASGLINSETVIRWPLNILLQISPFATLFILLVIPQLPGLSILLLFFLLFTLFGHFFRRGSRISIFAGVVLITVFIWTAISYVPKVISNDLSTYGNTPMPEFTLVDVKGNAIDNESLMGDIVVLDFFGTWCKPCIKELVELDKLQQDFQGENIQFIVLNADLGGDNPEKFKAFINSKPYLFRYAYDKDSELYNSLGFKGLGLPVLLIIDREQNIRYRHVGFNTAETNFVEELTVLIRSLQ